MIDSILSGVLSLGLLIGGAAAFGLEMAQGEPKAAGVVTASVTLPTVTVIGHRQPADTLVASR